MKAAVLGATGMLGSMVAHTFARQGLDVVGTVRDASTIELVRRAAPAAEVRMLDASTDSIEEIARVLEGAAWAVNAIGIIKAHIREDSPADIERAIDINARFPYRLARAAEQTGTRVVQIETDCVYSGDRGHYLERDEHDATDVYGRTKSLGEVRSDRVTHLRCSIIGPELRDHSSLLDWLRRQPPGATVSGYTNHRWNGVTTWHFARLCLGIMGDPRAIGHLQHVVPADDMTKAELLVSLGRVFGRTDVAHVPADAPAAVDRTIATVDPAANARMWAAAGYSSPPRIETMLEELAADLPLIYR